MTFKDLNHPGKVRGRPCQPVDLDRLADEVRLEIQRRKGMAANSPMPLAESEMNMPIVLRCRSSRQRDQGIFRSSRKIH